MKPRSPGCRTILPCATVGLEALPILRWQLSEFTSPDERPRQATRFPCVVVSGRRRGCDGPRPVIVKRSEANFSGRRVAVTGMGFITPIGNNAETVWSNLIEGVSGVGPISYFDTTHFDTKITAQVKVFNPDEYMDKKTAQHIGRYCQLALVASQQALARAKLNPAEMPADDVGVIVSSGMGGLEEIEKSHTALMSPVQSGQSLDGAENDSGNGGRRRRYLDLSRRPQLCEASITPLTISASCQIKATSERNDEPEKACRPIRPRPRWVRGGRGSVMLALEEMEHAKKRGANSLAEIAGYGASADMYHVNAPHPRRQGRDPRHAPGARQRRGRVDRCGLYQRTRNVNQARRYRRDQGDQVSLPRPRAQARHQVH